MLYTKKLNKNKSFLFLYKKGKCIVSKNVVMYVRSNNKPYNMLGITAGKKVGNAVKRNRAKRLIRQAYRENEALMPIGVDIVIVARASLCSVKSDILSGYLKKKGIDEIKAAAFGEK
jgi:ribonuclease P protein component